ALSTFVLRACLCFFSWLFSRSRQISFFDTVNQRDTFFFLRWHAEFRFVHLLQAKKCSYQLARTLIFDLQSWFLGISNDESLSCQWANATRRHNGLSAVENCVQEGALAYS